MVEMEKRSTFTRDFKTGAQYVKFSDKPVAATVQIEDGGEAFLADYDESGAVRGVEFIGGRKMSVEYYRALAAGKAPAREKLDARPPRGAAA